MPELPELEVMKEGLRRLVLREEIEGATAYQPAILKTFSPDLSSLIGQQFAKIEGRGKYLILSLHSGLHMVLHLMRSGWLDWVPSAKPLSRWVSLAISFSCGSDLRVAERGHKKRAKVWLVESLDGVPQISDCGIEPLSEDFTPSVLLRLLSEHAHRLKGFLTKQRLIAGIGNAYADEILYRARLSPFKVSEALKPEEVESLYRSIRSVLTEAVREIEKSVGRGLPKRRARDFLKVHGRRGEACKVCKSAIAEISYRDQSTFYCPGCQTGGRVLEDRRVSAFLK